MKFKNFSDLVEGQRFTLTVISTDFSRREGDKNIEFIVPPTIPIPLNSVIYEEFNLEKYACSIYRGFIQSRAQFE